MINHLNLVEKFYVILRYDVIFDTVGGENEKHALPLVKPNGSYIAINTPVVKKIDKKGIPAGVAISGIKLMKKAMQQVI